MAIKTVQGHPGAGKNYHLLRPLPFSRSIRRSSPLLRTIAHVATAAIAITATSIQSAYAQSASTASICDPFDPNVLGQQLGKLWVLATAINFFVFLGAGLVRDLIHAWIDRRVARGAK